MPQGSGCPRQTLSGILKSRRDKIRSNVWGHFWHHWGLDSRSHLHRWWGWHPYWCPCAWSCKTRRWRGWFWGSQLTTRKTVLFCSSRRLFSALVWSCRLCSSLYITYIDLKLCFCSFYKCIVFVSIQLWRNTFRPLNKFIAKMRINGAPPCSMIKCNNT